MRDHYCPVATSPMGSVRIAACGARCKPAPSDVERATGIEGGTSRLIYVRCCRCVALVRELAEAA